MPPYIGYGNPFQQFQPQPAAFTTGFWNPQSGAATGGNMLQPGGFQRTGGYFPGGGGAAGMGGNPFQMLLQALQPYANFSSGNPFQQIFQQLLGNPSSFYGPGSEPVGGDQDFRRNLPSTQLSPQPGDSGRYGGFFPGGRTPGMAPMPDRSGGPRVLGGSLGSVPGQSGRFGGYFPGGRPPGGSGTQEFLLQDNRRRL